MWTMVLFGGLADLLDYFPKLIVKFGLSGEPLTDKCGKFRLGFLDAVDLDVIGVIQIHALDFRISTRKDTLENISRIEMLNAIF
jgi:hypothetical protein